MKLSSKISLTFFLFVLIQVPVKINGQILKDTVSLNLVKAGIDDIYNFRFRETDEVCKRLGRIFPGHPVIYLLQGMKIYWENYPIIPSSPSRTEYENNLRKCIELCERNNSGENEAELLLADLSARGLLLLFYSDNNLSIDVIPLATSTYQLIRRSFDFTSEYTDFYFFTGLYNYYREAYPEVYPIYNMVAFLLPKGNRENGLKELNIVAGSSIFLKAEASSFLSSIYSSFENDFSKATDYSRDLHRLYIKNSQYLAAYIKNLLLIKKYDEAEKLLISNPGEYAKNNYFDAEFTVLTGILHEKKYHNFKMAEQYYSEGIKKLEAYGHIGNEFSAYGYFGLSRVCGNNDKKDNKKAYRKKALELADFKNINFD
jgi:hypothetical protein